KLKQQQIDAQQKQFEENLKQQHEFETKRLAFEGAHLDLSKAVAAMGFQQRTEETGVAPPGFTEVGGTGNLPGILDTGQRHFISGPELGVSFDARSQLQAAEDEAKRQSIIQAPKVGAEFQLHQMEKLYDYYKGI